jgi:hypothetical protein
LIYGTFNLGKLVFDIYCIDLWDGKLRLRTVVHNPKRKHIPVEGMVPYSIYDGDGKLTTVGQLDVGVFKEARDNLVDGSLFMDLPLELAVLPGKSA